MSNSGSASKCVHPQICVFWFSHSPLMCFKKLSIEYIGTQAIEHWQGGGHDALHTCFRSLICKNSFLVPLHDPFAITHLEVRCMCASA